MKLRSLILLILPALAWLAGSPDARGQSTASLSVLHSFSVPNNDGDNDEGSNPIAGLVLGSDGNLYGTCDAGGANGKGSAYRISPAGSLLDLHDFRDGGSGGDHPNGGLVQGLDGNFYGTNDAGSSNSSGTVYRMTPDGSVRSLYTFGGDSGHGALPKSSLVLGSDGFFYGTTYQGGSNGNGTVFQITSVGTLTTLYDFGGDTGHGSYPRGGLVLGGDGNFYGTTETGGAYGEGTVFQITSAGVLTTLFSFGADSGHGTEPYASLSLGSDGNFYGTTFEGGAFGKGTVFQITPGGALTTLYSFGGDATSGIQPYAGVTQGSDGNFYGVTSAGGANGNGAMYQLTPGGALTALYSFGAADADGNNADGISPEGTLLEVSGSFYGTANQGGAAGEGTVFQVTVSPTITSTTTAAAVVGASFSYPITATFIPTSYAASGLPAGLSIDPATGVITGTPTTAGTYNAGLTASNAGGSGTATLVLTVTASASVPPAPVFNNQPLAATATEGQAFTYQMDASNAPTSYTATGLPAGLNVDATSGVISGAPTVLGFFVVNLSATNAGGTGSAVLSLKVVPANVPVVTLAATVPSVVAGSGQSAEIDVSLSAAAATDVVVHYLIKGSAVNGEDYVLLKGTKKIKAGKLSKPIFIVPLGNGGGAGSKRTVALTLIPGTGYTVGTASKAKVRIFGQ